jgi:cephalosporin hydroxylase
MLPPKVTVDYHDRTLRRYWLARVEQHTQDRYAGIPLSKFPEDLRVFEHLLWQSAPNVVIELGAQFGGSALWFRDRLAALAGYGRISSSLVITVDLDIQAAHDHIHRADSEARGIRVVEGDVTDPSLPAEVERLLPDDARCLVIEDSAHTYATTRAALDGFAHLVPAGGFFVVEDGCVDVEAMRLSDDWPRGVLPAVHDWLAGPAGGEFTIRRDLELYGICCHPDGFLQRVGG